MRTTLSIADDVLLAAKELARQQKRTVGEVISDLARSAMNRAAAEASSAEPVLGFRPFAGREVVTDEEIDRLREDGPY